MESILHPGNKPEYSSQYVETIQDTPLKDKNILFLGSSVTFGACSLEDGIPEYFGKRFGCSFTKEAVSGTTLVDTDETSYVSRLLSNIDPQNKYDLFICQLSTNDAAQEKPLGNISSDNNTSTNIVSDNIANANIASTNDANDNIARPNIVNSNISSTNKENINHNIGQVCIDQVSFDKLTITGAIEYIISYVKATWNCPIMFYTGSRYESATYQAMVDRLYEIADKWKIGIIDLWTSDTFNNISDEERALFMNDPIHPTKAGYMKWWCPEMEKQVLSYIKNSK